MRAAIEYIKQLHDMIDEKQQEFSPSKCGKISPISEDDDDDKENEDNEDRDDKNLVNHQIQIGSDTLDFSQVRK